MTSTVYPKKYAHGFCFAVLWCGYTLTDFPISIRLTSLALWQSNDCPSASKATMMNMDKYFMWIHYERLHNHNKAKSTTKPCAYFLGYTVAVELIWFIRPLVCLHCVELNTEQGLASFSNWFISGWHGICVNTHLSSCLTCEKFISCSKYCQVIIIVLHIFYLLLWRCFAFMVCLLSYS